ncbi:hypothetical protein ACLESD_22140 [Pyxidicoccus sp. 3LFB2]
MTGGTAKTRTVAQMQRYQAARAELHADLRLLRLLERRHALSGATGLAEARAAASCALEHSLSEYLEAAEEAGFEKPQSP